jgi:hypothetical protein
MSSPAPQIKLLLSGRTASGMSSASAYLESAHGAVCWARSELMKRIAHAIVDGAGDLDDLLGRIYPQPELRDALRDELLDFAASYESEEGAPVHLYQEVVALCQTHDPLCFERELENRIKTAGKHAFIVIDDVKGSEDGAFAYFQERGYTTLRVEAPEEARQRRLLARDGHLPAAAPLSHEVETGLDEAAHDFVVDNDTSPERFQARLDRLVELVREGSFLHGANRLVLDA